MFSTVQNANSLRLVVSASNATESREMNFTCIHAIFVRSRLSSAKCQVRFRFRENIMSGQVASSAYITASPPVWNPLMNCYTGYFWSYAANAWMPYMELAPARNTRARSRSCDSSDSSDSSDSTYSYSYASSYTSSQSSVGSEKSKGRPVLPKKTLSQQDRGRMDYSSRPAARRSRSENKTRRSRSRHQDARVSHLTTGRQERFRSPSPRRGVAVRKTSRETRGSRERFSSSTGHADVASLDLTDGSYAKKRDWEDWSAQVGHDEEESWEVSGRSSSKWPAWKWTHGHPWKWSKKRNNKKRGGWKVQAKRAARSRPSEKTYATDHADCRDTGGDSPKFQQDDVEKIMNVDVSRSSDATRGRTEIIEEEGSGRSRSIASSNSSERSK